MNKKKKALIAIHIGNNTIITRKFTDGQYPKVNIFGLVYTLDDLVHEGWDYEIHYYEEGKEPISVFRCCEGNVCFGVLNDMLAEMTSLAKARNIKTLSGLSSLRNKDFYDVLPSAFYTAMAWGKFNDEKAKANNKEEENMYNNSIPTQDVPVCEEPIKNKRSPTIKEMMNEQLSLINDIDCIVDGLVKDVDILCAEQRGDANKMEIRDLNTEILANNDTLYWIRNKLIGLSDKIG